MKDIHIVIVEDSLEFSQALKRVLEEQTDMHYTVHTLNPSRKELPSFEEFHEEIEEALGDWGIVLLDQQLGMWRWTGAHLAPSFPNIISISSENVRWTDFSFTKKSSVAIDDMVTKEEFLAIVKRVAESMVPTDL